MLSESGHQGLCLRIGGFQRCASRYFGAYPRDVERVVLGYGTRLSGYTTLDPAKHECISLKPVPRRPHPFFL
jgi:hypothetical protein